MKRLFFLLCFVFLFLPVFSMVPVGGVPGPVLNGGHRGWIVEFREPCAVDAVRDLELAADSWQDKAASSNGLESSLFGSLAGSAGEFGGFVGAARSGSLSLAREKLIRRVCDRLGVVDCGSIVLNEFSLVFNGVALNISDEQAGVVKKIPGVKSVSPNYIVRPALIDTAKLIGLVSRVGAGSVIHRNVPFTGKGVKIGIIDTGIDLAHPAFGDCSEKKFFGGECKKLSIGVDGCWPEKALADTDSSCPESAAIVDFVENDADPSQILPGEGANRLELSDLISHGTHVASIAAGKPDPNGNGVQDEDELWGVAPDAEIVPLRLLPRGTLGNLEKPYSAAGAAMQAIEKAVDPRGVCSDGEHECSFSERLDVVNMSFSNISASADSPLSIAVDRAVDAGVVIVAAAGNYGRKGNDTIKSPAVARKAIAVGAVDKAEKLAGFSSRGVSTWGTGTLMKPDVVAPGVSICAALFMSKKELVKWGVPQDSNIFSCGSDDYGALSGTSMSSPIVAGLAALIREKHPGFSALEVKMLIRDTADDLGYPLSQQGFGLVNAERALAVEHAPPIAMLEPLGLHNNTVGFNDVPINGLAYGADFKEYTVEIGKAPLNSFSFKDDSSVKWVQVKKSSTPSRRTLVKEFKPSDFVGSDAGEYLLKLTVVNSAGQKSVDFLPIIVDYGASQAAGLKCDFTGSTSLSLGGMREWGWDSSPAISCSSSYCDATQFFLMLARQHSEEQSFIQSRLENAKKSIFWDYLNSENGRSNEQWFFDLTRDYMLLPGIKKAYLYYDSESECPNAQPSVIRNSAEIEKAGCTLDSDYDSFIKASVKKVFSGEEVSEADLAELESSIKNCYGKEYGLDNIYLDYSLDCESPESDELNDWERGQTDIVDDIRSAVYSSCDYSYLQVTTFPTYAISFDTFLEIQSQLARAVESGECTFSSDCDVELSFAGSSKSETITSSRAEWKSYLEFLEKWSTWKFGILLGKKLNVSEMDFLKKHVRSSYPYNEKSELLLVSDSLSEDFKNDFQDYYSRELGAKGINVKDWSFTGYPLDHAYKTGIYSVTPRTEFDFSDLDNVKISSFGLDVKLVRESSSSLDPFIFVPFDGEVGLENGRTGYGASISYTGNKPIYFAHKTQNQPGGPLETSTEYYEVKPTRGPDSDNIAHVKFEYSNKPGEIAHGAVLSVSKEPGALNYSFKFSPSIPIKLELFGDAKGTTSKKINFYYSLCRPPGCSPLQKEEYGSSTLFTWSDNSGTAYAGQLGEHSDAGCSGWHDKLFGARLELPPQTQENAANIGSESKPLASTIAFFPLDSVLEVNCLSGLASNASLKMQSLIDKTAKQEISIKSGQYGAGGGNLLKPPPAFNQNIVTLADIEGGVFREDYCINKAGNGVNFVWNTNMVKPLKGLGSGGSPKNKTGCNKASYALKECNYYPQASRFSVVIENKGEMAFSDFSVEFDREDGIHVKDSIQNALSPHQETEFYLHTVSAPVKLTVSPIECPALKKTINNCTRFSCEKASFKLEKCEYSEANKMFSVLFENDGSQTLKMFALSPVYEESTVTTPAYQVYAGSTLPGEEGVLLLMNKPLSGRLRKVRVTSVACPGLEQTIDCSISKESEDGTSSPAGM